jgi:hypothetical protein
VDQAVTAGNSLFCIKKRQNRNFSNKKASGRYKNKKTREKL